MQQISRTSMPKCNFNKVALQLYSNHTSAWMFSCKCTAYFQNTFFIRTPLEGCFFLLHFFVKCNCLRSKFDGEISNLCGWESQYHYMWNFAKWCRYFIPLDILAALSAKNRLFFLPSEGFPLDNWSNIA